LSQPTSEQRSRRRREIRNPTISDDVGFGARNDDGRGFVAFEVDVLDLHYRELGASAQRVVADADEGGIAKAGECGRTSGNDFCSDSIGEATNLLGSARSFARRTPHGKADNVAVRGGREVSEAMYESDCADPTFDGRQAVLFDLVVDELGKHFRGCGKPRKTF
jgi:hypothetical protein